MLYPTPTAASETRLARMPQRDTVRWARARNCGRLCIGALRLILDATLWHS